MTFLADCILFTVGYEHWWRMNVSRCKPLVAPTRIDFLMEMHDRLRPRRAIDMDILCNTLRGYLIERLVPGRLALPAGYDLASIR